MIDPFRESEFNESILSMVETEKWLKENNLVACYRNLIAKNSKNKLTYLMICNKCNSQFSDVIKQSATNDIAKHLKEKHGLGLYSKGDKN